LLDTMRWNDRTKRPGESNSWLDSIWKGLLSTIGYTGTIYSLINSIRAGKTWVDFAEYGIDAFGFLSDAAESYKKYKKIGNIVGGEKAKAFWLKNITGLKGRPSTAKNPFVRFYRNLTNKTSPIYIQFKETIDNLKGANGVGKAVASWGKTLVSGALNWFGNKKEQADSNGTMSDGRVIAETITETVVDYGIDVLVGAATMTVLAPYAAPGIAVVAISGAAVMLINGGVEALTGKTATEWISDAVLDTGEAIGNAVGKAAKNVSNAIGSWFKKLSFV